MYWADPDSLLNRAELARSAAERLRVTAGGRPPREGRRTASFDPGQLLDVVDVPGTDPLPTMLADVSIAPDERTALVFGGPAFQWR